LKVNGPFRGTCRFHLQSSRAVEARKQQEAGNLQALLFNPEDGGENISRKRPLTFNGLQGFVSQKTKLFTNHRCEKLKSGTFRIAREYWRYIDHTRIHSPNPRSARDVTNPVSTFRMQYPISIDAVGIHEVSYW
jgi:hypothetical protein